MASALRKLVSDEAGVPFGSACTAGTTRLPGLRIGNPAAVTRVAGRLTAASAACHASCTGLSTLDSSENQPDSPLDTGTGSGTRATGDTGATLTVCADCAAWPGTRCSSGIPL